MTAHRIGITGATGHIGGGVSRRLTEDGVAHRLLVRSPFQVADRVRAADGLLQAASCDFAEPDQAVESLSELDTVLFVSAHETHDRKQVQEGFVEALKRAGVRHVVYLSFMAASPQSTFTYARTHWATEQSIRDSGLEFTFLRDCFYLDVLAQFAGEERAIRGPAGDGRVAAVARADVIDVAASVLYDPDRHRGATYTLTGPEALSLHDIARVLTETTGRNHAYEPETLGQARASRESYGAAEWMLEGWISTYTAIASGELAEVTDDVARVAGHEPHALSDVARAL